MSFGTPNTDLVLNNQDLVIKHNGRERIRLDAQSGALFFTNAKGAVVALVEADNVWVGGNQTDGDVVLVPPSGDILKRDLTQASVHANSGGGELWLGGGGTNGRLVFRNQSGKQTLFVDGETATLTVGQSGHDGDVFIRDSAGNPIIHLDGGNTTLTIKTANGTTVVELGKNGRLTLGGRATDGSIVLKSKDGNGQDRIQLDAGGGPVSTETTAYLNGADGSLRLGGNGQMGDVELWNRHGAVTIAARAVENDMVGIWIGGSSHHGHLFLRTSDGTDTIHLDGKDGDIKLLGADCAEAFASPDGDDIEPGTVMVIAAAASVRQSTHPYDRRVAGIVSGAGAYRPGIVLGHDHSTNRQLPIALVGRVACKVDAQYAPIDVGDLLTTSPTPGHAMKAVDAQRAAGAVMGKALEPWIEGKGLIPVLVALQ